MSKEDMKYIVLLALLWLSIAVVVNPLGDFPLNDDWSYGKTVQRLVTEGIFRPGGWTSMTLFTQALYGSFFCYFFGFSFTVLRISTLLLAVLGLWVSYAFFRLFHMSRGLSFFCTLLVAFNPLFLCLSHSFMTDVPFTVMTMVAMYGFTRDLKEDSLQWFLVGILFSFCATLTRQLGFFVSLAYGISSMLSGKKASKAFAPLFLTLFSLWSFELWLGTIGTPKMYIGFTTVMDTAHSIGFGTFLLKFLERCGKSLLYLGLLVLPLVILVLRPLVQKTWKKALLLTTGAATALLILLEQKMPISGNILYDTGLGPLTLRDVKILKMTSWSTWPCLWIALTALSVISGVLVTFTLLAKSKALTKSTNGLDCFLFLLIVLYGAFVFSVYTFDRYLLVIFVPTITLLLSFSEIKSLPTLKQCVPSFLLLVLFGCYSIGGTHDYLSWNRTRWAMLKELVSTGVNPAEIDGGFEFNGYFCYDKNFVPSKSKSWWWVRGDKYVLTFNPIEDYEILKVKRFECLLPGTNGRIFLLKRKDI